MSCYNNSIGNSGTTLVYNGNGVCISPNDFDKYCNYSTNKPFSNIPGPPSNSKIKGNDIHVDCRFLPLKYK